MEPKLRIRGRATNRLALSGGALRFVQESDQGEICQGLVANSAGSHGR